MEAIGVLRPWSCRGPPRQRRVGIGEATSGLGRLLGSQHPATPVFEQVTRSTDGDRSRIERPTEMLARMAQSDAKAMVREHLLIEGGDQGKLLTQRRRSFADAGGKKARDLTRKPRPALRPASDHHRIGS